MIFAGDAAHQVSPFGARGANTGVQDVDNLAWKLKLVLDGARARGAARQLPRGARLRRRRQPAATPPARPTSSRPRARSACAFATRCWSWPRTEPFARPLVNSGRLSTPTPYLQSSLNTPDEDAFAGPMKPGTNCADAPVRHGGKTTWLLDCCTLHGPAGGFTLLVFGDSRAAGKRRRRPHHGARADGGRRHRATRDGLLAAALRRASPAPST